MNTILLIEDNSDVRENIAESLELAGYRVRVATNGKDSMTAMNEPLPDLILSDIRMPEMDGYETLSMSHSLVEKAEGLRR